MKKFTIKQLFSIVDGRLSTNMNDVREILGVVFGSDPTTIGLTLIQSNLKATRPDWFVKVETAINRIKFNLGEDFDVLMEYMDTHLSTTYFEVKELKL